MKLILAVGLLLSGGSLPGLDLPPVAREALQLELDGRLGEALDRYRAALSTDAVLVKDEVVALPETVLVLSKAAHLSVDLGYGEEAWDLGSRLIGAGNRAAADAGTLVQMRVLRLRGRGDQALAAYQSFLKDWKTPSPALGAEVRRLGTASSSGVSGPEAWVSARAWTFLPDPAEVYGLTVVEAVRLQVGAFQDWGHALTLIDMLREKGWVPFTDVKSGPGGTKLHLVYVVSRQPDSDRARLEAQGLTSLP